MAQECPHDIRTNGNPHRQRPVAVSTGQPKGSQLYGRIGSSALLTIIVLLVVFQDAFEVMLLPRRVHRRVRLTSFYFTAVWTAWRALALRLPPDSRRESFLSVFGALSMVILFVLWAVSLIIGFGVPATTMLVRHAEADSLGKLYELLREWEIWGSELLESHLSYPMLVYYRSQHDNQSRLAALAAAMDCCALILVGVEDMKPLQARTTFAMARPVIIEIARSFNISPSRYAGGDRLPHSGYQRLQASLTEAGLNWAAGPDTEKTLAALRATYEPLLDGLAVALLLPLPPWLPKEHVSDHWQRGHRGLIARRLIEQLSARTDRMALPGSTGGRLSQRLLGRLRRP